MYMRLSKEWDREKAETKAIIYKDDYRVYHFQGIWIIMNEAVP